MITLSEETRRMRDMMKMYNMGMDASMFGGSGQVLVLNANNKLSVRLRAHGWREYAEDLRTALRPGTAQPRFPDTGAHDEVYRTVE